MAKTSPCELITTVSRTATDGYRDSSMSFQFHALMLMNNQGSFFEVHADQRHSQRSRREGRLVDCSHPWIVNNLHIPNQTENRAYLLQQDQQCGEHWMMVLHKPVTSYDTGQQALNVHWEPVKILPSFSVHVVILFVAVHCMSHRATARRRDRFCSVTLQAIGHIPVKSDHLCFHAIFTRRLCGSVAAAAAQLWLFGDYLRKHPAFMVGHQTHQCPSLLLGLRCQYAAVSVAPTL